MSMPRWAMFFATTLIVVAEVFAGTSPVARDCTAPQQMTRFPVKLPNTARAIRSGKPVVIVAIGSSSTEGIGASDPAHAYPARLADELRLRWPENTVTVMNRGVGGQIASEMLARFERDVLPYHPQLVIWQTGSNQILRTDSMEGYADTIRQGIRRLKMAGADVILMDPQFAPRVLARPMHVSVVDSIDAIGADLKVAVFRRFAVMQHWIASGQFKLEDIISGDGLHMNDVSYNCLARLLAESVVAAAAPANETPQPHQAVKATTR